MYTVLAGPIFWVGSLRPICSHGGQRQEVWLLSSHLSYTMKRIGPETDVEMAGSQLPIS